MTKRGKSPTAQVKLRIPEALRVRIERAAKAGNTYKSLNTEILERLEASFHFDGRIGGARLSEMRCGMPRPRARRAVPLHHWWPATRSFLRPPVCLSEPDRGYS